MAPALVGVIGAAVERWGLRPVHKFGHVAELLFTFGLAFVIEEVVQLIWGRVPMPYDIPASMNFSAFRLHGLDYSAYRLFMLVVSVSIATRFCFASFSANAASFLASSTKW